MEFKEQFKDEDLIEVNFNQENGLFFNSKILNINNSKKNFSIILLENMNILENEIFIKKELTEFVIIFMTKIIKIDSDSNVKKIILEIPKRLTRVSKKNFLQLPIDLQIKIKDSKNNYYCVKSKNINGDSIDIESDKNFEINELLKIDIPFNEKYILKNIKGIIKKKGNTRDFLYIYHIEFYLENNEIKKEINSYIFQVYKILLKISNTSI